MIMTSNVPDDRLQSAFIRNADLSDGDVRQAIGELAIDEILTIDDIRCILSKINPNNKEELALLMVILDEEMPYCLTPEDLLPTAINLDPNNVYGSFAAVLIQSEGLFSEQAMEIVRAKIDSDAIDFTENYSTEFGSVAANLLDAGFVKVSVTMSPLVSRDAAHSSVPIDSALLRQRVLGAVGSQN